MKLLRVAVNSDNRLLYTILNNIEVCKEPEPQTKKISHHPVKSEVGEEDRFVQKFVLITLDRETGKSHE